MAYRNHPTRYLIVKDRVASPAVAGGQQEAATYAALNPASSTFFSKPADSFVGGRASGLSRSGGACLRCPVRPVKHFFFNHRFARLATRPRCRFRSAEEASTHPRAARQHFFSLNPKNRCPSVRVAGFRRRGGACLRSPARPVNAFFQSRPGFWRPPVRPGAVSRSGRGCLRGTRAAVNGFLARRGLFPRGPPRARGCLP